MHSLLLLALAAPDWPEFRGPTGQGVSTAKRVPTKWSPTENVAWKTDIPGFGWSSPVVAGGKAYLTTAVAKDKQVSLRALCLDAAKGKILWDEEVFEKKAVAMHGKNSHASPTPIVRDGKLYVHFGHYGTSCLELSGKSVWKNDSLAWKPVHGTGGSPVIVDGLLVFSRDGADVREVVALDIKDGKAKWQTERSAISKAQSRFSFSTPLVIEVGGKKQIISPGSDVVGAYDPKDGKEIWRCSYSGYSVIPRPVFAHGLLFLATSYNNSAALAVDPTGKGDVTETHLKWTLKRNAPHTPSMLAVGDDVCMVSDSGAASCVEAKTGEVRWTKRLPGKGYSASPILADGKIYFLSEDGVCTVVKPGGEYKEVARNELKEPTLASPAAIDGALFLRTKKSLYRIGKE
ncbi:MAG: PQQ-binding-like beta-propeller repeat protein [Gemmataceae bacterium]|nr:PQQ-binding-like beta-propeller repeat protein [Gemmataceae bacterium]